MSPRKRKALRAPSATPNRTSPRPPAHLAEIRAEFRAAIGKLKALGCEDSMILVEFWHALDCVNGED